MIPVPVVELNETHTALRQAAGQEAIGSKSAVTGPAAIKIKNGFWFVGDVHQVGNGRLHVKRQLVLGNASGNLRVIHDTLLRTIERLHGADYVMLLSGADTGW